MEDISLLCQYGICIASNGKKLGSDPTQYEIWIGDNERGLTLREASKLKKQLPKIVHNILTKGVNK